MGGCGCVLCVGVCRSATLLGLTAAVMIRPLGSR